MRVCLLLSFVTLALFSAAPATAQSVTDGVLINAKKMERDMDTGVTQLRGDVQVVFQGQHLSCDRADLNLKTQTLVAEGHVILNNERVHVEGDKINFDYKKNTGFIYHGFVQSGQIVFEGDVIEKIGESHYVASNAEFTACETCPPGWSFSGRNIDAEIGGYARIKRPVFKVAGFPVLILPSIIVPLKSSRQSGFLVPESEFSPKGGFGIGESYFWAINRSQDLTLSAMRYAYRGNKVREDYRYVLADNSFGHLNSAWIPDHVFDRDTANKLGRPFDRWFVDYSHHFEMPDNYTQRAEIHETSDLRYPRDFPDEMAGHGDPALENKASITKTSDNFYASGEVDVYTNLLKGYALSPNDDAVHRAPDINVGVKERQLFEGGPFYSMDVNYVNFARSNFNYDDLQVTTDSSNNRILVPTYPDVNNHVGPNGEIQHDGTFNPDGKDLGQLHDLNRTGQRLDFRPTISYPFQIAKRFDILPSVTYRETQYKFYLQDPGFAPTAARRYVQTDVLARTEFSRVYSSGELTDPQSTRWKHSIEPELGYSQIPWMRRPNHPFFGDFYGVQSSRQYDPISDVDLLNPNSKLQFDYEDRTIERREIDFGITNRFTRKKWLNGTPDYQTAALFRVWQGYDFTAAPHPWSSLNALLNMYFDRFETNNAFEYNGYVNVFNVNSRVRVLTTPQNFLQVTFAKNALITNDYNIAPGATRTLGFGTGYIGTYFDVSGSIDFALNTPPNQVQLGSAKFDIRQIQGWSYDLNIRPPGHCWVIRIRQSQALNGSPTIHFSANFDFGGDKSNTATSGATPVSATN